MPKWELKPICDWCQSEQVVEEQQTVYWELPDGSRAIAINETPSVRCSECGMIYQPESIIREIEDQLFLIDTSSIQKEINFQQLLQIPRLLKRNYFAFDDDDTCS
ncbi:YokU family protein [Aeribacillus pallidus]|jgi:uncharacterized YokU family protein|uniref:YokU family protein n=1 Tax=Aeribacillus pallidus TaxID=33936 RepID=UPI003D248669